jgi:hypothetical protein
VPPDAAILIVGPGYTALGDTSHSWDQSTKELFRSRKVIVVVNRLYYLLFRFLVLY